MVIHACNLNIWDVDEDGLRVSNQSELHSEEVSQAARTINK